MTALKLPREPAIEQALSWANHRIPLHDSLQRTDPGPWVSPLRDSEGLAVSGCYLVNPLKTPYEV